VSATCPACGAAANPGDRFCEACGADLPDAAGAAPAAPTTAEPGAVCASCGASQIADGYCAVCGMKQPSARDHTEVSLDGAAAVSDKGRSHPRNEDAYALSVGDEIAAVVCDGVSSTVNPDVASQAAADAALKALTQPDDDPPVRLVNAFDAAAAAVNAVPGEPQPPSLGWPSCTFLACIVHDGVVEVASAGDCRSYFLPDRPDQGEPALLTEDDSWAAEQIAAGTLTAEDAYADPRAHTITRWLGHDADPAWRARLVQFTPPGPGRLLLCSDGLWNYARTADEIAAAAAETTDPLALAQRLCAFANEQGGHDNITVVAIDLKGNTQ
jgi:serine/threonine protein phosphatase PrpC